MPTWSGNMEVVARAVCAKGLAGDGMGEEQLAGDADMWRHPTAAERECGVVDETGA